MTGGDAKVAAEAWNRLYLRGFRPARRSEPVSGAKMAAKRYTSKTEMASLGQFE
jgi:hypothetical protein